MKQQLLDTIKNIHIIGIGGSGTYPLVQIFHQWGYHISGSDNNPGDNIDHQRAMGIPIVIGHSADNIGEDVEAVIYSAAINEANPEIVAAKERGIPLIPRAQALGYVTRKYDNAICVAGTHGKTSTTAMLTQLLMGAQLDPTAVIGGKLPLIDGNGRAGKSSVMVAEACEYQNTYLEMDPDIGVILNVDEDHLEYFKNIENIIQSFHEFTKICNKAVIVNGDDANSMKSVEGIQVPIITFGRRTTNDYYPENLERVSPTETEFDLVHQGEKLVRLKIAVPGDFQIDNALAACAAALFVGATPDALAEHLPQFGGAGRRFEMLGENNGVFIADDYAHHPVEIHGTLKVAQTMGFNKVWAVHQPFTYSRTFLLLDDFAQALSQADHVVLSEIMGARETNTYDIYASDLAEKIPGSVWFPSFEKIADYVMKRAQPGDLVITLGCGDVYKCARMMLKN